MFEAWYVELTRIPGEEVGAEFWSEPRYLREAVTPEQSAIALDAALNRLGKKIPIWGDIHQAIFEPLVPELNTTQPLEVPLGGDRYTVNVSPNGSEDFNSSFGVSYRQIIDLSDLENSLYINPSEQSEDFSNPNQSNQLSLWQQGEYIPMMTEDYMVAERSLLQPSLSPPSSQFGTVDGDILEIDSTNQLVFAGSGNDLIDASASDGNNRIYGGDGDDTVILGAGERVIAGVGADRLFAGAGGNNTLTGGVGADQFWIAVAEIPNAPNTVTDFNSTEDAIGIAGLGIGFDELNFTQQGEDVLIQASGSDLAIFQGITVDSLSADNFVFA